MNAEDSREFRLARLTLLLAIAADAEPDGIDAERLGIYDFLAAHPLLVAREEGDPDRRVLRLAGFDDRSLAYASPAQRFVTAQLRLSEDLATLVRWELVRASASGRVRYRLTDAGRGLAGQFTARYAQIYADAARVVIRRARRMSGKRLRAHLRQWLTVVPPSPPRDSPPWDVT
ncbi:hypothetical protein Val02_02520 [Virgisporangium aliadipatigenens]|uniref:Uncharacterized protein n=1 Tax=Virgisporangium aliadipatigenens TaxID=741659 RepID=A0A8J3YE70_9ACTN|nr:hypothetical protein [Virgisporangium aliadipatigenens]GIJ43366.1 hypothetical protein Val02_02520 [Virgisporangium aliadipatigenens]